MSHRWQVHLSVPWCLTSYKQAILSMPDGHTPVLSLIHGNRTPDSPCIPSYAIPVKLGFFYFFFPFPLLALPFVDDTLTAREVVVDVPLLPAPLFTAVICLFCEPTVS